MDSKITFWTEDFSETNAIDTGWNYSEVKPSTSDHMNVTRRLPESNAINSYSGKSSDCENIFQCEVCKGQFPSESEFNCDFCGHTSDTSQRHSVCEESPSKSQLKMRYISAKYKCTVCDKSFNCKSHLEEHSVVHTAEKAHKCNRCYRSNSLKSDLTKHSLKCTGQKFECEICNRSFSSEFFLDRHVSFHAKRLKCDEGLKCSESGFYPSVPMKVTQQMHGINEKHSHSRKSVERENIFKCEVCNEQFPSESELNIHFCGHSRDTSRRHSVCDESPSKSQLKMRYTFDKGEIDIGWNNSEVGPSTSDHMNVTRQLPESNAINSYSGKSSDCENIFKCEVCKGQFPSESEFNCDSCGHTSDTSQRHSVCEESPSKSQLKRRYTTEENAKYKCTVCDKSFNCKSHLEEHSVVHTGEKPYKCDLCYRSFSFKSNLTRHSLKCTGKEYECEICNRSFNRQFYLDRHLSYHTDEERLMCDEGFRCSESGFSPSVPMKVTQQMHGINETHSHKRKSFDRENIFKFEVGSKQFHSESVLKFHSWVHTGETLQHYSVYNELADKSQLEKCYTTQANKEYKCTKCDKSFTCISELGIHILTHTDVNFH